MNGGVIKARARRSPKPSTALQEKLLGVVADKGTGIQLSTIFAYK